MNFKMRTFLKTTSIRVRNTRTQGSFFIFKDKVCEKKCNCELCEFLQSFEEVFTTFPTLLQKFYGNFVSDDDCLFSFLTSPEIA